MFKFPVNFENIKKINSHSYIFSKNIKFINYKFIFTLYLSKALYKLRKIIFRLKILMSNNLSNLIDTDIKKILYKQKTSGGLYSWYSFVRLCELVVILRKFKFDNCIEFGSGSTSFFLHKYCKKHLSIEENLKWKNKTLRLNKKINIFHSIRVIKKFKNEACSSYKIPQNHNVFKEDYDLVYIDGPTSKNNTHLKSLDPKNNTPNVDIFKLFNNNYFPKFILIDGRRSSIRLILKNYHRKYNIYLRHGYQQDLSLNLNTFYHTILIRKN